MTDSTREQVFAFLRQNPATGRSTLIEKFHITDHSARKYLAEFRSGVDLEKAKAERLFQQVADKDRSYRKLLSRVAMEREIIEEFRARLEDVGDLGVTFAPVAPTPKEQRSREQAVLVLSDSHVGKIVRPDRTLGFGNYSPSIFLDRLAFIDQTVSRLIVDHVANPVETLHVLFLGDLVEGMLNHCEEIPSRWHVVDQVMLAALAMYQLVARLSRVVPKVVCRGVVGNHGRWPSQKKVPTDGRFSNFDFIVMGQVQAMIDVAGPDNVEFVLEENAFQVFDIYKWRLKVGHGDHLKGGDKALGIPAHSIGREQNATTQRYAAKGLRPPDYYIVGDKHRPFVGPTATGRFLINGAFFAEDEFAQALNFSPCRPFQMFFGIHPDHGRSWSYDLSLDNAKQGTGVKMYSLPERLLEKL